MCALGHASDPEDRLMLCTEMRLDACRLLLRGNEHHADPHVERAVHLRPVNVAPLLQKAEDRRHLPRSGIDLRAHLIGEGTRDVFIEPAARDVHHTVKIKVTNQRQTNPRIETRRRQQLLADAASQFLHVLITAEALVLKDDLAHEGVAIGMYA